MFDKERHGPLFGSLNTLIIKYVADDKPLNVIWPDGTQYPIKNRLLENHDRIFAELSKSSTTKMYKVSDSCFINILYFEFQMTMIEYGLLPLKTGPAPITSMPLGFYLEKKSSSELILSLPILLPDFQIIYKDSCIPNNEKVISKKVFVQLMHCVETDSPLNCTDPALMRFILQNYPLHEKFIEFSQFMPKFDGINRENIQQYKNSIFSIQKKHNFDEQPLLDAKTTQQLIEANRVLMAEKNAFLRRNPDFLMNSEQFKLETQKLEHKKINRLFVIISLLYKQKFMADKINHIIQVLQMNKEDFKQLLETKDADMSSASPKLSSLINVGNKLPQPKPATKDETPFEQIIAQLNLGETSDAWFDDEQIRQAGNHLLQVIPIQDNTYTFIHNASSSPQHYFSIKNCVERFQQSQEQYLVMALNLNENHWIYALAYRDKQKIHVHCINSMAGESYQTACNEISEQLRQIGVNVQFTHLNCQRDGHNCGPWTLYFMEQTLRHLQQYHQISLPILISHLRDNTEIDIQLKRQEYESCSESSHELKKKNNLRDNCLSIEKHYKKIEKFNAEQINVWAQQKRNHFKTNLVSENDINEAIAYLDQCYFISSNGNRLRNTQKIAILLFMQDKEQGHIAQMNTSEGKTVVVACVQALKIILQGYKTHVFTSNTVLAEDGKKNNQTFFDILNITVAHNNPDEEYFDGPKDCYAADIVYGTISNFQFDWMRHEFECQNTMGHEHDFNHYWVMMDEIDSLLIDQGGNLAKLSTPFPGMGELKFAYLEIWEELKNIAKMHPTDMEKTYDALTSESTKQLIKHKINALIEQGIIPIHLTKFIQIQLPKWLESAFHAKFIYEKEVEYNITEQHGIPSITPIDNDNTGAFMHNTIYANALHQFLQIKHFLSLSSESPTSSFVSNLGFVDMYNNRFSGITGTIGSRAEQSFLNQKLKVTFSTIPPFKEKNFLQYEGEYFDDLLFINAVASKSLHEAVVLTEKRAVLVICSCIKDVNDIQQSIIEMAKVQKIKNPTIKLYCNESQAEITKSEIEIGDIVIATNISGRGTDFKTSDALERNGGLHVIMAFLPNNQRVQDQGFGRTSRNGKSGSGQMLIRCSEFESFNLPDEPDFELILLLRDVLEEQRLEQLTHVQLKSLAYHDELFSCFSKIYQQLKKEHEKDSDPKWRYILKDLKEKWAIWLLENSYNESSPQDVTKQFEQFKDAVSHLLSGYIVYNPYYSIQLIQNYLRTSPREHREKAQKELSRILNQDAEHSFDRKQVHPECLFQLYQFSFELDIDGGEQLTKRLKQALADLFNVSYSIDTDYLIHAKSNLEHAKTALLSKIKHLKDWLEVKNEKNSRLQSIADDAEYTHHEHNLLESLNASLNIFQTLTQNIDTLIHQINTSSFGLTLEKSENCLIEIKKGEFAEFENAQDELPKKLATFKQGINIESLQEAKSQASGTIYALSEVHRVEQKVLNIAKLQIGGGVALLLAGSFFPWSLTFIGPLAGAMITEGILDILSALTNNSSFNEDEYNQSKMITYAIALVSMGLDAILKCTKIITKVIDCCRNLAKSLRNVNNVFAGVCKKIADYIERFANHLERAMFSAMSSAEKKAYYKQCVQQERFKQIEHFHKYPLKNIHPLKQVRQQIVGAGKNGVKKFVRNEVGKRLLSPFLEFIMQGLKPLLKQRIDRAIRQQFIEVQPGLRIYSKQQLEQVIKQLLEVKGLQQDVMLHRIGLGIANLNKKFNVKFALFMLDVALDRLKIDEYVETKLAKFNQCLQPCPPSESLINEEMYLDILNQLSDKMTKQMFNSIIKLSQKIVMEYEKIYKVGKAGYQLVKKGFYVVKDKIQDCVKPDIESNHFKEEDGDEKINQGHPKLSLSRKSRYDFWLNYNGQGIHQLLRMRLQSTCGEHLNNIAIISHIYLVKPNFQQICLNLASQCNHKYICIPLLLPKDSHSNHWVGIVLVKQDEQYEGYYLDSENELIPKAVYQLFEHMMIHVFKSEPSPLNQIPVPQQHFNNCGQELVENITKFIANERAQEEQVLEFHHELYLQQLIYDECRSSKTLFI